MTEPTDQQADAADQAADASDFELTDEQDDALVLDRNVTITAGAGTGKTTTLTERYLELLNADPDCRPTNIATITFTRKAAAELETRVREEIYAELAAADTDDYARWREVLDDLSEGYIHTIHAFCARLLRENAVHAPVPMEFEVLDEDEAATLQRQVVVEYLDAHKTASDVRLASQLFGSHDRLVDILTGLLNERPDSEAWLKTWRDRDIDDYMSYLWEHVCDFDADTAANFFTAPAVKDALETATDFTKREFEMTDPPDGVAVLRDIDRIVTTDYEDNEAQRRCRELYDRLETSSGGLYASASHHLIGTKSSWEGATTAYSECKDALNALLDELSAIEAELQTTPGEVEANSAHYVFALLRVFDDITDAYTAEKATQEALDFPDLIATTLEFLTTNPEIQAEIRAQFQGLMVDEFQDTDHRQWELVSTLAGLVNTDIETNSVFLVGDKKQSIYSFRGADVTTFETAKAALQDENKRLGRDSIPDGTQASPTELELSGNFRTLESPLTVLNELFAQVFEPLGDAHDSYEATPQRLTSRRDETEPTEQLTGSVEYMIVPEDDEAATELCGDSHPVTRAASEHAIAAEAEALGARLAALLESAPTVFDTDAEESRPAEPRDIAILLRRRTHLDRYQRALDSYNIPYSVISGRGFYDTPAVQTLINLLRVLADPTDAISLYGVLRSPLFGFTDDRLADLATGEQTLWDALTDAADGQLSTAATKLTEWRALAGCIQSDTTPVKPWNQVLTQVFDDTGYLISIGADENGSQAVANVEKFRDEIREWSDGGTRTAASLLRRINRQAELDVQEGEAEIPAGTEGVRIMTIHAAKGLEFPIVAVPDLGSDLNFGRSVDDYGYVRLVADHDADPLLAVGGPSPSDAYTVDKTIAHEYADTIELPRERAEAKRLLYVACTRTRDHLLLCGTHSIDTGADDLALESAPPAAEATAWKNWVQPALLDHDELLKTVVADGTTQYRLGDGTYSVSLPPITDPLAEQTAGSQAETSGFPHLEIPEPDLPASKQRETATELVQAAKDRNAAAESSDSFGLSMIQTTSPNNEISSTVFGTIVHRILECGAPESEWPRLARRIAGITDVSLSESDLADIIAHVDDATSFLSDQATKYPNTETYAELTISVDVGEYQIVGDIDHLRVTPDRFVITDYKTNDLSSRSPEALATQYRPQMMSYAVGLMEHDSHRDIEANLRFTDAGRTETFVWSPTDQQRLIDEILSIEVQAD